VIHNLFIAPGYEYEHHIVRDMIVAKETETIDLIIGDIYIFF